jgi:enoyl-CoA hydratase/carnithine racemase
MENYDSAGMVTADEAYRTGLVNHVVPQVELWNSVMGGTKNHETLLWRSAKLSSQLMLIIKTVKMALKQK